MIIKHFPIKKRVHNNENGLICFGLFFNMTVPVDEKQYYYVPVNVKNMYVSISYFKINLQNNHKPGVDIR